MKKILVLPGWMTSLKLYENSGDIDVRIGKLEEGLFTADCVVGVSLGALIVLQQITRIQGRVILVNPPLPKRGIVTWFFRWINYMKLQGFFRERQKFTKDPFLFCRELIHCKKLLAIDFSKTFDSIPSGKVTVIRGENDRFFCDAQASDFLRSKHIEIVEVEGGHNWCKEIEKAMYELTRAFKN